MKRIHIRAKEWGEITPRGIPLGGRLVVVNIALVGCHVASDNASVIKQSGTQPTWLRRTRLSVTVANEGRPTLHFAGTSQFNALNWNVYLKFCDIGMLKAS
ncbi:hypothetical protein BDW66DRAFT_146143 [Aspergillus desertorum]